MSVETRLDELLFRYEELREQGEAVSPEELCRDCPELLVELRRQIDSPRSTNCSSRPTRTNRNRGSRPAGWRFPVSTSRYPSAQALAQDLRRFLDGLLIAAPRETLLARAWRWQLRLARLRDAVVAKSEFATPPRYLANSRREVANAFSPVRRPPGAFSVTTAPVCRMPP